MSGGSFSYLCYSDAERLLGEQMEVLVYMSDELASLGYADDAARETQQLIIDLRIFKNRIETSIKMLAPVWHEMEWWRSGDVREEDFKESLVKFRNI